MFSRVTQWFAKKTYPTSIFDLVVLVILVVPKKNSMNSMFSVVKKINELLCFQNEHPIKWNFLG